MGHQHDPSAMAGNTESRKQVADAACGGGLFHCFGASTLIDTPAGPRPVEALQIGDLVNTLDHGAQPIIWTWCGRQPLLGVDRGMRPVLIRAGSLGPDWPQRDLVLSPHHRVLVGERDQFEDGFEAPALAPAQSLTQARGIRAMMGRNAIHWFNFACERHEVVSANGVFTESLLIGAAVLASMSPAERRDINALYPGPRVGPLNGPPARPLLPVLPEKVAA